MGCTSSKRREGPPPVVDLYAAQPYSGRAAPAGENPAAEDQLRNEALIGNAHPRLSKAAPEAARTSIERAVDRQISFELDVEPDHDHDHDNHDPIEELAIVIAGANISSSALSAAAGGAATIIDLDGLIHLAQEARIPAPPELLVDVFHQLSGGDDNLHVTQITTTKLFAALAASHAFDEYRNEGRSSVAHLLSRTSIHQQLQSDRRASFHQLKVQRASSARLSLLPETPTLSELAEPVELPERYVSLVAHNDMKPAMMVFVATHLEFFKQRRIVTTGSTGRALEQKLGLDVAMKVSSGPLGGDQEIGAMISKGEVAAVFFFRDPLSAHPHESDILALGRICDVHNIMVATNTSTGGSVIHALEECAEFRDQLHLSPADFSHHDSEVVQQYKEKQKAAIAAAVAGPAAAKAIQLPADKGPGGNTDHLVESSLI